MEVTIVIHTEIGLVIDTVELGGFRLFLLSIVLSATPIATRYGCLFSTHTLVGLTLLADQRIGLDGARNFYFRCNLVNETNFILFEDSIGVSNLVVGILIVLYVNRVVIGMQGALRIVALEVDHV